MPTTDGRPERNSSLLPELKRADGDVILVFLSGDGVLFAQKMDDDWYRASVAHGFTDELNASVARQSFRPAEAASPMGCVEQWQWCNSAYPKDQGCGPLASFSDAIVGAAPFFNLTEEDVNQGGASSAGPAQTRFMWEYKIMSHHPTYLDKPLQFLGAKSLVSQDRLYEGMQWALPNNQWHLDVGHWFDIVLASTQASFVDTAALLYDPELGPYVQHPLNEEEKKLCNSQKIRSTAYVSFNLFGLYFTLSVGFSIVALSYVLEPVQAFLHKRRTSRQYAYLEWMANSELQLHRLAHEESETPKWSRCTEIVPITHLDTILGALDIADPKHPVLSRAPCSHIVEKPNRRITEQQGYETRSSTSNSLVQTLLAENAVLDSGDGTQTSLRPQTTNEDIECYSLAGIHPVDQEQPVPAVNPEERNHGTVSVTE